MNIVLNLILIVQVLAALAMVGLVLLQHGKGADMGASFGSGSSGSLFGATGSANFLSRSTAAAATIFFAATLALAYFGTRPLGGDGAGVMSDLATKSVPGAVPKPASAPAGIAQIPGAPGASQSHAASAPKP